MTEVRFSDDSKEHRPKIVPPSFGCHSDVYNEYTQKSPFVLILITLALSIIDNPLTSAEVTALYLTRG